MAKYISTSTTIELVEESNILYLEAYQNYTKIILSNNRTILSNDPLKTHEKTFEGDFFRVHNSFLCNLRKVKRYFKIGKIELANGTEIPVSRRRRTEFIEKLKGIHQSDEGLLMISSK